MAPASTSSLADWIAEFRRYLAEVHQLDYDQLSRQFGPLPIERGFQVGDSPQEFFEAAIQPLLNFHKNNRH
jgi:hypothetical protein